MLMVLALARVVLAGGCFWGMQGVFEHVRGVSSVVAGYAGGSAMSAHYDIVETGRTRQAESVEITYDPKVIRFEQLLDVYFLVAHNPTERNYQGPDYGTQYRSEIFYTTPQQRRTALQKIHALESADVFAAPIVTEVAPLAGFYPAEAYHQHFVDRHPNNPYVVVNDLPKIALLRARFPQLAR